MGAGGLRDRVTIQRPGTLASGYVDALPAFVDVAINRPAEIESPSGSEAETGGLLDGSRRVLVRVRTESAIAAIDTDWRIINVRTAARYNVRHVGQPARPTGFVTLTCTEGDLND